MSLVASILSDALDERSRGGSPVIEGDARSASSSFIARRDRQGQGSIAFICTIASSMMGSTLMSLPWAFENAGLVASLVMITLVAAVSYYTCFIILKWGAPPFGNFSDFGDLCAHYLGPWGMHVANGTSVALIFGVLATYHVLMASSLQTAIVSLGEMAGADMNFFCCGDGDTKYFLTSVVIGILVFPLLCFKNIDFLMKIGSFGSVSVAYNFFFIVGNAILEWPEAELRSSRTVKMSGNMKDFGVFFGTLGLSLFIHNLLLQASSGHRDSVARPNVVKRDIAIAYGIAVTFYIAVGAVPAVAYELGGRQYKPNGKELPQVILLAYGENSWGALIGQLLLTMQVMIVYPLLGTVIRRQFFASISGTDWPGWPKAIGFSVFLVFFTTLISSVYPHAGKLVGYVGVYTAIVYMLGLPILVHLMGNKANDRASTMSLVGHVTMFVIMVFCFLLQFIFL